MTPEPKPCGRQAPDVFVVNRIGDRFDARNVGCVEPSGHNGPRRFAVEW